MLIDTHCHLNFADAFPDVQATLAVAAEAGVTRVVVVGVDLDSSAGAVELAERHPEVFAVVGFHPNYCSGYESGWLDGLRPLLKCPKVVAVGEIGLDYHWEEAERTEQASACIDQLDLAREERLPAVFHCREAYDDLLALLKTRPEQPYLFHCFSGNEVHLEQALALGAYVGVDGPLTYPKATDLRSIVAKAPRERVVLETDSPYLPPQPFRGKPNQPAYVVHVAETLAALWGVSGGEAAAITTENAKRYFGL